MAAPERVVRMSRTVIVGDVHGCVHELNDLLDQLRPTVDDQVVMVGDTLDRGPDSAGVLRLLRDTRRYTTVLVVRGNHEQKHINRKNMQGQDLEVSQSLDPEDHAFLRESRVYRWVPEHGILVVHGGVPVGLDYIPKSFEEARGMENRDRKRMAQLMYTVNVDVGGSRLAWGWAYDGRFGHVVFGHRAAKDLVQYPHATGVDLGCVYGGNLCALVLDSRWPGVENADIVKVPARQAYAEARFE